MLAICVSETHNRCPRRKKSVIIKYIAPIIQVNTPKITKFNYLPKEQIYIKINTLTTCTPLIYVQTDSKVKTSWDSNWMNSYEG